MENTLRKKERENRGVLETAILSAHMKFFNGTPAVRHDIEGEESVLYKTVIRYFTNKS